MLSSSELRRASQLNKYYAFTVCAGGVPSFFPGWAHRLGQISIVLGISNLSEITAETFAQYVADWQIANGIVPVDGVLGQRTFAAILQKAQSLPNTRVTLPNWLKQSPTETNAPVVAQSKMIIPARAWLFAVFHELPEVGQRNLIRKVAAIPSDRILRPADLNGTMTPAEHAMGYSVNGKSQFLSASKFSHGSATGGLGDPAVLIDIEKVKKAGGRVVSTKEIITGMQGIIKEKPYYSLILDDLMDNIQRVEGETLIEGKTPKGAVRQLSPQHMNYLTKGYKLYENTGVDREVRIEKLRALDKSYQNARMVGRVGRVLGVVGVAVTAYDIGDAANKSIQQKSIRPIAAESIRQVGGWTSGVAGAEIGFVAGAAAGIETGPGAILTGGIGAVICGALGYFGSDLIADYIYEN